MTDIVHRRQPRGSGLMPCCGRTFAETPGDRQTTNPEQVTCGGTDPLADPWLHPINAGAVHLEPEQPIRCGPPLTGVRMDPEDAVEGELQQLRDQLRLVAGYADAWFMSGTGATRECGRTIIAALKPQQCTCGDPEDHARQCPAGD